MFAKRSYDSCCISIEICGKSILSGYRVLLNKSTWLDVLLMGSLIYIVFLFCSLAYSDDIRNSK